jgi:[acyl-carrier-protein] S-malonyltransferase
MKPAAEAMSGELEAVSFQPPNIPIIQNVHAQIESEPGNIRHNLVAQICSAVKWTDTVQLLSSNGVEKVVECGPGKILCGLIKRIDRNIESLLISDTESLHHTLSNI